MIQKMLVSSMLLMLLLASLATCDPILSLSVSVVDLTSALVGWEWSVSDTPESLEIVYSPLHVNTYSVTPV